MAPRKAQSSATRTKLAKRLKTLREQLGLSQRQLAKEWHVTHGSIRFWENGERAIPGTALKLIEIYEEKLADKRSK